jgi:flagellar protein FliS
MTTTTEANAYLRTQVLTASPEQLRLMLLDGALRFAGQAAEGLASDDFEAAYNGITQARAIVLELATSIRPDVDPELADRVQSVYMYLYRELIDASVDRDQKRLGKAIELLEYERETWALLMDKLAAERAANSGAAPATPPPTLTGEAPERFSAEG